MRATAGGLRARETEEDSVSPYEDCAKGYCMILVRDQWPIVREMRLAALRESPQAFLGVFEDELIFQPDDWIKTFESASWHGCFIADSPVGIAKSSILTEHPEERYIESFWVNPQHRNRRIARLIVHSIVDEARREGRLFIRLSVLHTNRAAIAVIRQLGFSRRVPSRTNEREICLELLID